MSLSGKRIHFSGTCSKARLQPAGLEFSKPAFLDLRFRGDDIAAVIPDVTVAPAVPEEDNFLITLPLTGKAQFHYGAETSDVEPGRGAIIGPYHAFRFDIDGSFDEIVLRLAYAHRSRDLT